MNPAAIVAYIFLTIEFGPLRVNSSYRDPVHNAKVGGVPNSRHIHGKAYDIDISYMDKPTVERLMSIAHEYFDVVILYKNHIHIHIK
jgi:uncharacterized protein YcbK (DUF882 family)